MKSKNRILLSGISLICCCILLTACVKNVKFVEGKFPEDSTHISIVLHEGETELLNNFSSLQSADFTGSTNSAEIADWARKHPQIDVLYEVSLADGQKILNNDSEIEIKQINDKEELKESLLCLPKLEKISFSSELEPELVIYLMNEFPQLSFEYSFDLLGSNHSLSDKELDLSSLTSQDLDEVLVYLPYMSQLEAIDLGIESSERGLSWDDVAAINAACPNANLKYSFTAFGKSLTLDDEVLNLRHIVMDDEGILAEKIAHCMNNLKTLDMDSCGVSNERMAEIRDSLPGTDVIWRIVFGFYSVRTDVEHIMASNPGMGGNLYLENTECLKYCTKLKYLDLGHNRTLDSIAFVSYMPDLEVAILAMCDWCDASPLADCPKLEYLELFETGLDDLRPLAELENLRHLNIGQCYALHDLSPIYGLTNLERLWIGRNTPIPPEQVEEMQKRAPNCVIDVKEEAPLGGDWRFMGRDAFGYTILNPRYMLLCEQMGYGLDTASYAYYYNDPLYYGPGHMAVPALKGDNLH